MPLMSLALNPTGRGGGGGSHTKVGKKFCPPEGKGRAGSRGNHQVALLLQE